MSNQQIGHKMRLSRHTVGTHVLTAMHRLGAQNRTELIARCYFAGLLEISSWPPKLTGRRCVPALADQRPEKSRTAP